MDRNKLYNLYYGKKLSMIDIAEQIGFTHAKIYYWFKKYKLKRRSWSESSYVKQNPDGGPFKIKRKLNNKQRILFISGLMLYAAEGNRANRHSIQLANLDHQNYWSKTLNIPRPQINIYTHTDKRSKFEEQKSKFGIARIQVHNYKLKNWIDREIDEQCA